MRLSGSWRVTSALVADARDAHRFADVERRHVQLELRVLHRVRGQHGLETNYRRMFLLVRALEDYFLLRNAWFRGEKEAFAWLLQHDNSTYQLFERAAAPTASDVSFADLVRTVYGPHQAVSA